MRKHVCFACGRIVLINLTTCALASLFLLCFHHFFAILAFSLFSLINVLFIFPAYSLTYIDENGIHNRHFSIRWEDIKEFRYFNLTEELGKGKFQKISYPSVIGIGTIQGGEFSSQSTKNAVFFSVTKRNMNAIRTLCKEKNDTVNDILSWEFYSKLL